MISKSPQKIESKDTKIAHNLSFIKTNPNTQNMKKKELTFKDFESKELSKDQQKTVRGGDGDNTDPNDPGKKTGTGNGFDLIQYLRTATSLKN